MIRIKLLVITISLLILNSCNGKKTSNDLQPVNTEKKLDTPGSNTNNKENKYFSSLDNQISQVVRTIFQDSKGNLWFGTQNGAFKLQGDSLIQMDKIVSASGKGVTIKDITEARDGKIWLGHTDGISSVDGNIVTNYYESDGLISNDVWSVAADDKGNIWIGTIEGMCVFDGEEFKAFKLPEGKKDTTLSISSSKMVHNIFQDTKGTLWFSSNAGLFSYVNDSLTNVSERTGIQTNFINEVFEDKKGELWVSTKAGLYNLKNDNSENITEGIIETGKGIGSIAEDKNGNLWFVSDQHHLFTYDGENLIEFEQTENNKAPVTFEIFKDRDNRLWFVGFGGAYRLENGNFINVTRNGPW